MPEAPAVLARRLKAWALYKFSGMTAREVGKEVDRGKGFVLQWFKQMETLGHVNRKVGSGRPLKIKKGSKEEKQVRKRVKQQNSTVKAKRKLEEEDGICIDQKTVWAIVKRLKMKAKPTRKRPALTEGQRKARLAFALLYVGEDYEFWKQWLFSDEKKYYMYTTKRYQWCDEDEEPKVQKTWAVPPSCYVWAGISAKGRTKLRLIKGGLTADKYIDILEDTLLPAVPAFAEDEHWVFQQDSTGRGSHGAHKVRNWLNENVPDTCFPWPANSPDLNPIENLWYLCNQQVQEHNPRTKAGYWRLLKKTWESFPQSVIESLIKSMPRRCQAVIDADGGNTKY